MNERMTAQEAIAYLQNYPRDELHFPTFWRVMDMSIATLQASVPRILTLAEARALEPHTPAYAEYKLYGSIQGPFGLGEILPKPDVEWPQYGRTVRWWTAWPSEELRKATEWSNQQP